MAALLPNIAIPRTACVSCYIFEATRNDSFMYHFNHAINLGWLINIGISRCTSLQEVITYAAKYCSKSEEKSEAYCRLVHWVLSHTAYYQHLRSFPSRLMDELIVEIETIQRRKFHTCCSTFLCRKGLGWSCTSTAARWNSTCGRTVSIMSSYDPKTWRRLGANARKRVLFYCPRYKPVEASAQFHDFAALS
ncbi:hypothetical protein X797_011143 [Metarhizium robertsii]|uniref:Uncharacterized protein n=1 Tax=Metarhizium robertsii TaxID=568076 RepID=A0A014MWW1_9HYPO|nr:hypothetical protein X797_011143 [Metarhizium robertsii]